MTTPRLRSILPALLVPALALPAAAETGWRLEDIPEGTPVRISSRSLGLAGREGTVVVAGHRGLVVDFAGLERGAVPLPMVDRIEVLRYRGRATPHLAAAGAGIGLLLGAYVSVSDDVFSPEPPSQQWGGMILGGAIGAVIGAMIGSTMTYERWQPLIWYENDSASCATGLGFRSAFPAGD